MALDMKAWLRLTLVVVSVGGGFVGVVSAANLFFSLDGHPPLYVAMVVFIFILYTFVIGSGLVFVYDPRRTRLLQIALLLQTPWISSPILLYNFGCALFSVVRAEAPGAGHIGLHFWWIAQLGSIANISLSQQNAWSLGVNLFAGLLFILLRASAQERSGKIGSIAQHVGSSHLVVAVCSGR